jgi:hypothetical protein
MERAANGYVHAQGTDALRVDAQDAGAVLTDDLRARHAMCVVVEAQDGAPLGTVLERGGYQGEHEAGPSHLSSDIDGCR